MKHLKILADPLKVRGQIQVIHHQGVNDSDLDGEMEEEVVEQVALPFPRWYYRVMIIDPTMIIYW